MLFSSLVSVFPFSLVLLPRPLPDRGVSVSLDCPYAYDSDQCAKEGLFTECKAASLYTIPCLSPAVSLLAVSSLSCGRALHTLSLSPCHLLLFLLIPTFPNLSFPFLFPPPYSLFLPSSLDSAVPNCCSHVGCAAVSLQHANSCWCLNPHISLHKKCHLLWF